MQLSVGPYKYPASRGSSLRQHALLVYFIRGIVEIQHPDLSQESRGHHTAF